MRNNDVFSILVATGDQAIATSGGPGDLAVGQLGLFNAETNTVISTTEDDLSTLPKSFYIALGTANGPRFSAGQKIQSNGIVSAVNKDYVAGVNKVVTINDYVGAANTEYAIRFEFINDEITASQGSVQYSKTYTIMTPCADKGDDVNEVTRLFIDAINADLKPQMTVVPITNDDLTILTHGVAADYSAGDPIVYADLAIIRDYNIDNATSLSTGFTITTIPATVNNFNDVSLKYIYPRETDVLVGLITGFDCNGTVTVDTALVYEQGLGYDVKQREYQANGWIGKPGIYRTSPVNGIADPDVEYLAVATTTYDSLVIEYDNKSSVASTEYESPLSTEIVIPTGGTTTYAALIAKLNPILSKVGLPALS